MVRFRQHAENHFSLIKKKKANFTTTQMQLFPQKDLLNKKLFLLL